MKKIFFFLLLSVAAKAEAQLKTTPVCPVITIDLLEGNVNGIESDFSAAEIKKILPCFSSEDPETSACGARLNYATKDLYFFTGKGYIEIREKFKDKLSLPVMGAARSSLFKWLGYPKIKDINWDAFTTKYGILVLHYNKTGRVNLIQFSKKSAESLTLCE